MSRPAVSPPLARLLTVVCLAGSSCAKTPSGGAPAAGSASASGSAQASLPAAPSASASAAPAPTSVRWSGTYTSAPGTFYVRDGGEWKGVHFRGDDAAIALGEGALSFTVDRKTSLLRGAGSGPLGDVVLSGAVTGSEVTFSVLRKDAANRGLTGTGVGTIAGDSLTGTMRLSRGDAHVIREATFTLAKASP